MRCVSVEYRLLRRPVRLCEPRKSGRSETRSGGAMHGTAVPWSWGGTAVPWSWRSAAAAAEGVQGPAADRRALLDRYGRRRVRLALHELPALRDLHVDWSRFARPDFPLYTPNQIQHLMRFDSTLGRPGQTLVFPTLATPWLRDAPRDIAAPWRMPDLSQHHISLAPRPPPPAPPPPPRSPWWEGGLPVGAVLLALLVLIVRRADKCLDRGLFKLRRRQSEEWPTPNVIATSIRHTAEVEVAAPCLAEPDSFPDPPPPADLPPPYSECAPHRGRKLLNREEPPPPYSACYVAFSNPKDGIPSVHFYNSQRRLLRSRDGETSSNRNDEAGVGLVHDTGQESSSEGCDVELAGSSREFIFDNGRIIERRAAIDLIVDDQFEERTAPDVDSAVNGASASPSSDEHVVDVNMSHSSLRDRYLVV